MKPDYKKIALAGLVSLLLFFILFGTAVSQGVTTCVDSLEPIEIESIEDYALSLVVEEWGYYEWESFDELVWRESDWDNKAQNPNSTAYGIGQFLDGTWDDVGCIKSSDAKYQLDCMIKYIAQRYEGPADAIVFHDANDWY